MLLPNGKKQGNEWRVGSIDGEAGQSLGVSLSGSKAGVWSDFATGQGGDLLDLWCAVRQQQFREAIKDVKKWLGIAEPKFYKQKTKKYERPAQNWSPAAANKEVMQYLQQQRKLTIATIEAFKLGAKGQDIVFPYWRDNKLIQTKFLSLDRPNGKKQIRVAANCEPCLFGWQTIPQTARQITLTEGELDAMSLYQYGISALSLPFGGGTGNKHQWLEYEFERLAIFDVIYICFDNDTTGQATITELLDRIGRHRCRVVVLPHKDANACLQADVNATKIQECFADALSVDPEELKQAREFVEQVIEGFYPSGGKEPGMTSPWRTAKDKVLFRPSELSIWTGTNGHGKSQFLGQIILHTLREEAKVCIASLEIKPKRLLMRLTRQASGLKQPSQNYIRAIHDWYGDKLWLFDLVGTAKAQRLLEVFLYARQRYGIEYFVIDSLLKCDIAEDDYTAQKAFIEKLCDFKNEHNCHVHLVVHPRKGSDESRTPTKLDAKGTGAITDLADNCFTVWRNKSKESKLQAVIDAGLEPDAELKRQIDCLWLCDKQRNGDWEGKIGLWFDAASTQYLSYQQQHPFRYVNYSNEVGHE